MPPFPEQCQGCPLAGQTQNGYVPPDPLWPGARLIVYGEAAGADEARIGRGFVGAAGRILRGAAKRAGLRVEWPERGAAGEVTGLAEGGELVCRNVVCCRPRGNEFPPDEIAADCLRRHWPIHAEGFASGLPVVVCGANAARVLCGWEESVLETRGAWVAGPEGRTVLATLHPSYIARGESHLQPLLSLDLTRAIEGPPQVVPPRVHLACSPAQVGWAIERAKPQFVALDIEGQGGKPALVGLSWDPGEAWVMWWDEGTRGLVDSLFRRRDIMPILHNAAYDLTELRAAGVEWPERWVDTIVLAALFNPSVPLRLEAQVLTHVPGSTVWKGLVNHKLGPQVETEVVKAYWTRWQQYLADSGQTVGSSGWRTRFQFYNGLDTAWTLSLALRLRLRLGSRMAYYREFLQPLQRPLLKLGQRGLPVDPERMRAHKNRVLELENEARLCLTNASVELRASRLQRARAAVELLESKREAEVSEHRARGGKGRPRFSCAEELGRLRTKLRALEAEGGFNPDSVPARLALLEWLGLPLAKGAKTKGFSTADDVLLGLLKRVELGRVRPRKGVSVEEAVRVLRAMVGAKEQAVLRRNFLERTLVEPEEAVA